MVAAKVVGQAQKGFCCLRIRYMGASQSKGEEAV